MAGDGGAGSSQWTTIESDPGVFTELIEKIGVKGVEVDELYCLDESALSDLSPVYGLIFLYKWTAEPGMDFTPDPDYERKGIFFAKQVVQDACATQALLSVLLNVPGLDLGQGLRDFRDFTSGFPPDLAGLAVGDSALLREAHNSFGAPHGLLQERAGPDEEGEAFHFVAYVPADGAVYELDGTKAGPVRRAEVPGAERDGAWARAAAREVARRIAAFPEEGIKFSLLAVIRDRRLVLQDSARAAEGAEVRASEAVDDALAGSREFQDAQVQALEARERISTLRQQMASEAAKREQWAEENERRRTDYVPAIAALLRGLAARGRLGSLADGARREVQARRAAELARGGR